MAKAEPKSRGKLTLALGEGVSALFAPSTSMEVVIQGRVSSVADGKVTFDVTSIKIGDKSNEFTNLDKAMYEEDGDESSSFIDALSPVSQDFVGG